MKKSLLALAFTTSFGISQVQADEWAIGTSAGTLGFGLEVTKPVNNHFNVRFGINKYADSLSREINQINYQADLNLQTVAINGDWHPFSGGFTNGFRLTAGFMINNNEISASASPADNINFTIGDTDYSSLANISVNSKISFRKFSPYLGFGFDKVTARRKGLSLTADFGVLFQGAPEIETPTVSGLDAALVSQVDLDREVELIEEDLSDFNVWPVIALGLNYQF